MPKSSKPNILVIWGDDIGMSNLSCYSHGVMGYRTPNIDRIAKEGMMFTDAYGEQSCTAGRSSFITGQSVYRTGLSKVGIPGAPIGMNEKLVTIAACLKNQGYATGQFGKNHLGDLNHMLPTNHGFDEFFGNLYHLNAEEEPELPDYSQRKRISRTSAIDLGPRGVMHTWATDVDDPSEEPRWGRVGKQRITDTGPLTKKRMETSDDEFVAAAKDFIKRQDDAGKPFFVWLNTTHMHLKTQHQAREPGASGRQSPYHDTMIDHDKNIGQMMDYLDETSSSPTTPSSCTRPTTGSHRRTPGGRRHDAVRSEKNTNWEGAFRVPMIVRWPRKIGQGQVSNEIVQHHDWFPTFLAMAGDPDVVDKPRPATRRSAAPTKTTSIGYNLCPIWTGQAKESPRKFFMYLKDDGDVLGMRYDNWKIVFMEQRRQGTLLIWGEPFTRLRIPKIYNLRTDPFERADETSNSYWEWYIDHIYMIYGAQALAAQWGATFKDFPPIQKPNTFTLDEALAKMHEAAAGMH